MNVADLIAHVKQADDGTWDPPHSLREHLSKTACIAATFADKFSSREWGESAGMAHDVGKGRAMWQSYLRRKSGYDDEAHLEEKPGKIPHAIFGAKFMYELHGEATGRILSYCIAGHHAGLPDWEPGEGAGRSSLQFQLSQAHDLSDIDQDILGNIRAMKVPLSAPWKFSNGLDMSLWIRMLYSCLVDADFLDTECYMEREKSELRRGYCSISELLNRLNQYNDQLTSTAEDTLVNRIRRDIREKCVAMGEEDQGIFSLSVPTGGGKTLSGLAFALEHAKTHGLDRVIYVIPYTSIIEQNADVFRKALGEDQVVEHHSSLNEDGVTPQSRLAAENWDAPVIVTTSVQFFESLFAAKSSRCRKLHNMVRSVVVLDEAQLVPVDYLEPILQTMQLLVDRYRVSFVISTATQPALGERTVDGTLFKGLKNIREIVGSSSEVNDLFDSLKRVEVQLPTDFRSSSSWEQIAVELKEHEQVLCVVSDRKSCRELFGLMPDGSFHLSALMCGQHRSEVIETIKKKLKTKQTVRVISTQLVEAGVDFDFPVVYRALAGLDSIAQAAGRCNREGKLATKGKVVVFVAPRRPPTGILRKAAETTQNILVRSDKDPLDHSLFNPYFSELYWKANSLDTKGIHHLLSPEPPEFGINFRTAAGRFEIIDSSKQRTIFVRYKGSDALIDLLKYKGPDRSLMRKLQRYAVNIYTNDFFLLLQRGSIEEVYPNIYALTSEVEYDQTIGLMVEQISFNPRDLMV